MAAKTDKLAFVEPILKAWDERRTTHQAWDEGGNPVLDYDLLGEMLTPPAQTSASTADGRYAGAVEIWVAEELRQLGFDPDATWPRRSVPRVLPPDVARLMGVLDPATAQKLERAGSPDARIWGSAYIKQTDVGVASSWRSGPEVLVSVKTQSSSFGKNANNRIEESYGDGKNLKRRFPLACLGYFLVLRDTILSEEPLALQRYIHALGRFVSNEDAYDAAAIMLVHWDADGTVTFRPQSQTNVPDELSPEHFFKTLVDSVLNRAPSPDSHGAVRALRFGPTDTRVVRCDKGVRFPALPQTRVGA